MPKVPESFDIDDTANLDHVIGYESTPESQDDEVTENA